jgi:hypothetical protein
MLTPNKLTTPLRTTGVLLCNKMLLQRRKELLCFGQCQAKAFEALPIVVQDGEILHSFVRTVLCTRQAAP